MTKIKMQAVDLHVHSTRSDGTLSPAGLVDLAMEKGLAAFALTDHDTVDGLAEAAAYAAGLREKNGKNSNGDPPTEKVPEVIPGIEFSTEYQGQDVHIVGLYIDYRNAAFSESLQAFVDSRIVRNQEMCRLLRETGIDITYEKLLAEFPDAVITRAHYARYLWTRGYVGSIREAFDRYIGDHCPCYVPREKVTPVQAVLLIRQAGGFPVLAHPILYRMSDRRLDALTAELKESGLMGLEAVYSTYTSAEERQMRALAAKYDLLVSGGSDFHGANKPGLEMGTGYGRLFVPETLLLAIKNALGLEDI